jgi:hypothetical protein
MRFFRCYPDGGFALAKHLWSRLGNNKICMKVFYEPFLRVAKIGVFGIKLNLKKRFAGIEVNYASGIKKAVMLSLL